MTIPVVGDGEYLGAGNTNEVLKVGKSTQPVQISPSSSGLVGFFGTTPVVRRTFSSAIHISSNVAVSSSFGATQLAVLNELQATMIAYGLWPAA